MHIIKTVYLIPRTVDLYWDPRRLKRWTDTVVSQAERTNLHNLFLFHLLSGSLYLLVLFCLTRIGVTTFGSSGCGFFISVCISGRVVWLPRAVGGAMSRTKDGETRVRAELAGRRAGETGGQESGAKRGSIDESSHVPKPVEVSIMRMDRY